LLGGAAVAHRKHMSDDAKSISLDGTAHSGERAAIARPAASDVLARRGKERQLGADVAHGGGGCFRRREQRLLARLVQAVACERIEAAERRARHQRARGELESARFQRPPLGGKIAAIEFIERPPAGQHQHEHDRNLRHRQASAIGVAPHGGKDIGHGREGGDNRQRPHRHRSGRGHIRDPFPNAIEHDEPIPWEIWPTGVMLATPGRGSSTYWCGDAT
jgi:hypothetical protein